MSTTLKKEAFVIKDRLAGGNSSIDDQMDERDIMKVYRQEMQSVARMAFYDRLNMGDRSQIVIYVAYYPEIEVKTEGKDGYWYAEIPEFFMDLPHNKGIVRVSVSGKFDVEIYPNNNPYVGQNIPVVANLEGYPWYFTEGFSMKFGKNNWKETWKKVDMKLLIPAPDSIGENDALPIIPSQISEIRNKVTEYFQKPVIQDVLNDGNKDRGVNTN